MPPTKGALRITRASPYASFSNGIYRYQRRDDRDDRKIAEFAFSAGAILYYAESNEYQRGDEAYECIHLSFSKMMCSELATLLQRG